MSETTVTTLPGIPAGIPDEMHALADAYGGVRVEQAASDLPGFDYYELFGWHAPDADLTDEEQVDPADDVRIGGRLVLTLEGGRGPVTLTEQETADVMWALANATRRNRKAKAHGNNPEREARFERQVAVMAKINAAPTV